MARPRTHQAESSPERAGFVAALRANPDDEATRLIFADWLEEHGDAALAAFVRLQLADAALDHEDESPEARAIRSRHHDAVKQRHEIVTVHG